MTSRDERARRIQRDIAAVLLRDWDPLGPSARPDDSDDDYDAYVGPVYRLLASGATPFQIAEHLADVEHSAFGFAYRDPHSLLPVAEKLRALDVRLEFDDHAS